VQDLSLGPRSTQKPGLFENGTLVVIWEGARGAGIVFLIDSRPKARGTDIGNIIKNELESQQCKRPVPQIRHRAGYPSRFPIFTPDAVQGCSDKSVDCRFFVNAVSKYVNPSQHSQLFFDFNVIIFSPEASHLVSVHVYCI
jgi:hypothetical protein